MLNPSRLKKDCSEMQESRNTENEVSEVNEINDPLQELIEHEAKH